MKAARIRYTCGQSALGWRRPVLALRHNGTRPVLASRESHPQSGCPKEE